MSAFLTNPSWKSRGAAPARMENLVLYQIRFKTGTAHTTGTEIPLTEIPFGSTVISATMNVKTANSTSSTMTLGVCPQSNLDGSTLTEANGGDADGIATAITLGATAGVKTVAAGALVGKPLDASVMSLAADEGEPLIIYAGAEGATYAAGFDAYINILVLHP